MASRLIILLLCLPSYLVRALLWLTRLQQKEYRFDRFWHFLTKEADLQDLLKFFPQKKDLTRTGLTRPKLTPRLIVVTAILELLILIVFIFAWQWPWWLWLIICLGIIAFLPLLILISSLPTALVFEWRVQKVTRQAQQKINKHQPKVIGITGSYGKTGTKILLQHILQKKFSVYATQKSFNTRYSLMRDVAENYQGQEITVIEYAAYKPGEIKWLAEKIKPNWAVITGLAPQHLAIFGSVQNIIQAKAELIEALPQDGLVFLNAQDTGTLKIFKQANQKQNFTDEQVTNYTGDASLVKLGSPNLSKDGELNFVYRGSKVQTKLIGKRFLSTVAAAISVAEKLSLPPEEIKAQLETFQPPDLFVSLSQAQTGFWLLDDGRTTNPAAFADVIELAQDIAKRKKIKNCYLISSGIIDLGDKSDTIHEQLAKTAKQVFTQIIYTGSVGKKQFSVIFQNDLIEQETEIKNLLNQLTTDDLVVIEGWIPIWLKNYLGNLST